MKMGAAPHGSQLGEIGTWIVGNLACLIEFTTADADRAPVDRYGRWLELRPRPGPNLQPGCRAATVNAPSYLLGTRLPDFWYPLVSAPGRRGEQRCLADVPPEASGLSDDGFWGTLVARGPDTVLADEEASRVGTRVKRRARLAAGPECIVLCLANIKGPGRGESGSGLRFDVLG
jgi:hypothetical protein